MGRISIAVDGTVKKQMNFTTELHGVGFTEDTEFTLRNSVHLLCILCGYNLLNKEIKHIES
jgi:hypothetical protein